MTPEKFHADGRRKRQRRPLPPMTVLPEIGMARMVDVQMIVRCSESLIRHYVRTGLLAPPVRIGARAVAWPVAEVRALLERLGRGDAAPVENPPYPGLKRAG